MEFLIFLNLCSDWRVVQYKALTCLIFLYLNWYSDLSSLIGRHSVWVQCAASHRRVLTNRYVRIIEYVFRYKLWQRMEKFLTFFRVIWIRYYRRDHFSNSFTSESLVCQQDFHLHYSLETTTSRQKAIAGATSQKCTQFSLISSRQDIRGYIMPTAAALKSRTIFGRSVN